MSYHQWQPKPLFDEQNPDPREAKSILQDAWTVDLSATKDIVKNAFARKGYELGNGILGKPSILNDNCTATMRSTIPKGGAVLRMRRYDPIQPEPVPFGSIPAEVRKHFSAKLLSTPVPNLIHKLSTLQVPLAQKLEEQIDVVQEERVYKYVFKKDRRLSNYYKDDDWKDGIPPIQLRRMVGDIWIDMQTGRTYTLVR